MEYKGTSLTKKAVLKSGETLDPYFPSKRLLAAVNYAILAERPLLLKGEPGCGKTFLAKAIAHEWFGDNYPNHYFEWSVRSSSKASEGRYTFDHIARLRDAQIAHHLMAHQSDGKDPKNLEPANNSKYVKMGPLGKAFRVSAGLSPELEGGKNAVENKRTVVLIDEIDKADIDFPNDLLLELDQMRFNIEELDNLEIKADAQTRPLIIITSNDEKELPVAFLRRCIFHYIDFPDKATLEQIVERNFNLKTAFRELAVKRFLDIRTKMEKEGISDKKVSTSELKDWAKVIDKYLVNGLISEKDLLSDLGDDAKLPFYQVLFKTLNDQKQFVPKGETESQPPA